MDSAQLLTTIHAMERIYHGGGRPEKGAQASRLRCHIAALKAKERRQDARAPSNIL
jgi:hypothetical protein